MNMVTETSTLSRLEVILRTRSRWTFRSSRVRRWSIMQRAAWIVMFLPVMLSPARCTIGFQIYANVCATVDGATHATSCIPRTISPK
jgi:hypothetical protein